MTKYAPTAIKWVGANGCHPSRYKSITGLNAAANVIYLKSPQGDHIQLYHRHGKICWTKSSQFQPH